MSQQVASCSLTLHLTHACCVETCMNHGMLKIHFIAVCYDVMNNVMAITSLCKQGQYDGTLIDMTRVPGKISPKCMNGNSEF